MILSSDDLTVALERNNGSSRSGRSSSNILEFLSTNDRHVSCTDGEFGMRMVTAAKILSLQPNTYTVHCKDSETSFYNTLHTSIETPDAYKWSQKVSTRINSLHRIIDSDGIKLHAKTIIQYNIPDPIKLDVLIVPRKKERTSNRNFGYWSNITQHLIREGLSVGVIGSQQESVEVDNVIRSFEYSDPSHATLRMMTGCKTLIGGDTGPTHVYHNFLKPTLILRVSDGQMNLVEDYPKVNPLCSYYEHARWDWNTVCKLVDRHLLDI